jgi:hypothetical protein
MNIVPIDADVVTKSALGVIATCSSSSLWASVKIEYSQHIDRYP